MIEFVNTMNSKQPKKPQIRVSFLAYHSGSEHRTDSFDLLEPRPLDRF